MLDWKEIVQNYIIKYSDKIKKTTRPLRDHLGIAYFTYHRIDREGKYTVLLDRPDWAEHYVDEKFYLEDPFLRHPDVYQNGFCLIENHGTEEHRKRILKDGKEIFNLDQGVILVEKQANCVEFFGFSGNKADCALDKLYINHPHLLKSFAGHFKRELGKILLEMEKESSSLVDLKGSDFYSDQLILPDVELASRLAYLKDIGLEEEITKASRLTLRERECLKLLLCNKSAKETAAVLGLSRRTVEFYFENIKNKLSCSYKHEVLALAKHFEELGIL